MPYTHGLGSSTVAVYKDGYLSNLDLRLNLEGSC